MSRQTNLINITARCTMIMLIVFGIFLLASAVSNAESVMIGQACRDENGNITGGSAGDQTGGEVDVSEWEHDGDSFNWDYVLRAKDPSIAKKLAENMKAACSNDHIGYDQDEPDRNSFYDAAEANDWDIATIETYCETTCSSAVSVCLNAAGVDVPRSWASSEVYSDVMSTGMFDCYTSADYVASSANLLPGDILVTDGRHTAMVVESPNLFQFEVNYVDGKGRDQVAKVEEGKSIQLNYNNGEKIQSVKIKDKTDLKTYKPEKHGYSFAGWKNNDDKTFTAEYKASSVPIKTDGKTRVIGGH